VKLEQIEPEQWGNIEKQILIQTLDHHWKEHLGTLDALRQVIPAPLFQHIYALTRGPSRRGH